jgi:hypothetical protein
VRALFAVRRPILPVRCFVAPYEYIPALCRHGHR